MHSLHIVVPLYMPCMLYGQLYLNLLQEDFKASNGTARLSYHTIKL